MHVFNKNKQDQRFKKTLWPLFCLIFISELIPRIYIIHRLSHEIIYRRMILAGLGADLALTCLLMTMVVVLSFFLRNQWLQFAILTTLMCAKSLIAFTNFQYSSSNLQLFPLKYLKNYGGQAVADPLYFKGLLSEIHSWPFLAIFVVPFAFVFIGPKIYFSWLKRPIRSRIKWIGIFLFLGIVGNIMKWSFEVVRFVGSPLTSNYIYYWIDQPDDAHLFDYSAPSQAFLLKPVFQKPEKALASPVLDYQPNIVIITVESFRANENSVYGGEPGITPYFDRLSKQGVVFSKIFHNGCCTPSGMFAILCAQQPQIDLVTVNHTYVPVLCMSDHFKTLGYDTAWVHAMGSGSDRFGSFQRFHQVDHIVDGFQYPKNAESLGWSFSDAETIKMAEKTLLQLKEPFYLHIQTQTNHDPFTVPEGFGKNLHGNRFYNGYLNTMRYSDEQIGKFVEKQIQTEKGERTIFIIVADHGLPIYSARNPSTWDNELIRSQIPLLMIFPRAFSHLPSRVDTLGSQVDILPTLLDALGQEYSDVTAGFSLFQKRGMPRFVYITHDLKEMLLTKQFFWKIKPQKELQTWEGKPFVVTDPLLAFWGKNLPILRQFNLWHISCKNWRDKQVALKTMFKEPIGER